MVDLACECDLGVTVMGGHRFVRIVAVLVRAPQLPFGDLNQTLTFIACLKPDGRLDERAYRETCDWWSAKGSVPSAKAVNGRVVWDRTWGLQPGVVKDDPVWPLVSTILRPGEYMILQRPDGAELVFRVVNVGNAATLIG